MACWKIIDYGGVGGGGASSWLRNRASRGGGAYCCTENFMKAFMITIKLLYASVQRALIHMRCLFTEFRQSE